MKLQMLKLIMHDDKILYILKVLNVTDSIAYCKVKNDKDHYSTMYIPINNIKEYDFETFDIYRGKEEMKAIMDSFSLLIEKIDNFGIRYV